jgi:amidohydrolase
MTRSVPHPQHRALGPLRSAALGLALLCGATAAAEDAQRTALHDRIDAAARALEDRVVEWRRHIHRNPELSNREFRTAAYVAEHLRALGLRVETDVAHTGVVALLEGGRPGPVVALRADMDALPVVERTDLSFASTRTTTYDGREVGVMHACGHDNHVAILMGAAEVLAGVRDELPGTVKFLFQPAEEGPPVGEDGGAAMMIREGALRDPDVDAVFGLHISQRDAVGEASYRARGMMASAQTFRVTVTGRQTHGAAPWAGIDPVVTAAQMITSLQTVVSRSLDITNGPAVVTVGTIHGGTRYNIVPDSVSFSGTIRTFDPGMKRQVAERMEAIIGNVAGAMGASAELEIERGVPVTFNDPDLTEEMVPSLRRVYGDDRVRVSPLITGAEDFSFFMEEVPGFFFFVGGRPAHVPAAEAIPNHSPFFDADEGALVPGVRAMASLAVDYLTTH